MFAWKKNTRIGILKKLEKEEEKCCWGKVQEKEERERRVEVKEKVNQIQKRKSVI